MTETESNKAETSTEKDTYSLPLNLTPEQLEVVRDVARSLGSPTLGTALYNAAIILRDLYAYQSKGWQLRLESGGDSRRFKLP